MFKINVWTSEFSHFLCFSWIFLLPLHIIKLYQILYNYVHLTDQHFIMCLLNYNVLSVMEHYLYLIMKVHKVGLNQILY